MLFLILLFWLPTYTVEDCKSFSDLKNDSRFKEFIVAIFKNEEKAQALLLPEYLYEGLFDQLPIGKHPALFQDALAVVDKHKDRRLLKALIQAAECGHLKSVQDIIAVLPQPQEVTYEERQQYFLRAICAAAGKNHIQVLRYLQAYLPKWRCMKFEGTLGIPYNNHLTGMLWYKNTQALFTLVKQGVYIDQHFFDGQERAVNEEYSDSWASCCRKEKAGRHHLVMLRKEQLKAKAEEVNDGVFYQIEAISHSTEDDKAVQRENIFQYIRWYPLMVSPHLRDRRGNTLLHAAAKANDLVMFIHLYLLNRSLLYALNDARHTPLSLALGQGNMLFTQLFNIAHGNQHIKSLPFLPYSR